jgi:hypothetical protein
MERLPDTVVLINGLWMTALSWENWVKRYSERGYKVIAKSWPGMDIDIEQSRRDPSPIQFTKDPGLPVIRDLRQLFSEIHFVHRIFSSITSVHRDPDVFFC